MAFDIVPLDAGALGSLVATNIQKSASKGGTPSVELMAASVAEVTVQTQTLGASLLSITIIDPGWVITRAGFLDVNADGLLDEIDINFPAGSGLWWRLAMLDITNDLAQPNLTLTFQDRIVSYLQDCWGPVINTAGVSRARFIKSLIDRMPHELKQLDGGAIGQGPIAPAFVCKELNVVQPIAGQVTSGGTTFVTDTATQNSAATKVNKKVIGASTTGGGAWSVHASQESLGGTGCNSIPIIADGYSELSTVAMGTSSDFAALGHLDCQTPMIITNPANGKSVRCNKIDNGAGGGNGLPVMGLYPSTAARLGVDLNPGYCTVVIERADGGALKPVRGTPTSGTNAATGTAGSTTTTTTSDLAQLTRGTSQDPDEDTWTASQRLANEVNWPLFSNGDTLYFDPGTSLIAQKPALYLELDATGTTWTARNPGNDDTATDVVVTLNALFDNTAYRYQSTKKRKGKVQRQTRIRKPQTPSQIRLTMVCGVFDYRAGDVFVFRGSGPINGPWLVVDTTRNCLADRHTQFTLAPGTAPNPEPTSTSTTAGVAAATALVTGSIGGYINPFAKMMSVLRPERIDMGVDYGCSATGEIVALGPGTITNLTNSGWNYGGSDAFIEWKLTAGAYAGKYVYFAEAINPTVHIGQTVNTGDVIGTMIPGGSGIECGWGVGAGGTTLAAQMGDISPGDAGGRASAAGLNFNAFLVALGAPSGTPNSGGKSSAAMPAGWPGFYGGPAAAPAPKTAASAVGPTLAAADRIAGTLTIPSLFGT